jgi:excinuclease UvrABC ATPase subunit
MRAFIAQEVLKEIRGRLQFLLNVGLDYLTLDRTAPTLSGGESQRIRLAGQIGSGWSACCTSWTSRRSACIPATTTGCSAR